MHPRAAASLFVGSEKFFYPRADSPIHFFAFEIPSRSSAGDSARIRSGFACREKNTVRAKSTRSFCKICKYLVSLAPRWRFGCRGCPFFCAFSPLEPARMSDRPRARRLVASSRAARHSPTRGAVPRRCTARRRRWTPRRRYCDGSSPTRRVRVSREDARGSLARARSSSLSRAQPRRSPSRFERALTPSPPRAPVASLPQAPRSSRAC